MKNTIWTHEDYKEYHLPGNLSSYVALKEASRRSLTRVLNNLKRFSYILVSASRQSLSKNENETRFKLLKKFVKDERFSFIPVKRPYVELETNVQGLEDSLLIFPVGRNNTIKTDEELFSFGLSLIQFDEEQQDDAGNFIGDPTKVTSFGQDSFLFESKNGKPAYYDKEGKEILSFSEDLEINNMLAEYFTQLINSKGKNQNKFTFKESYISEEPQSVSDRHVRYLKGELLNYY